MDHAPRSPRVRAGCAGATAKARAAQFARKFVSIQRGTPAAKNVDFAPGGGVGKEFGTELPEKSESTP